MKKGKDIGKVVGSMPLSGGSRNGLEVTGIDTDPAQTILKVTDLQFPIPDPEVEEKPKRQNQRKHPQYTKPELLATQPNEVWSWDRT